MCINCGINKCTCEKIITLSGPPGKRGAAGKTVVGPKGDKGDTGPQNLTVANTVFVMKNGNDSTGLVERLDKPFLTISAARIAALAAFTSRTSTSRARIVVETGEYTDKIIIDDFIDYDLNDSTVIGVTGFDCILDNGNTYSALTPGEFNAIIYGNATFTNTQSTKACLSVTNVNSGNLKVLVYCNRMMSSLHEAVMLQTGKACIYANEIYLNASGTSTKQCVNLATSSDYEVNPYLEVHNARIYTNKSGSINSCIEFSNANPGLNENYSTIILVNCEVGSWSTTRPAINGDHTGTGFGNVILKNTVIFTNSQPCIADDSSPSHLKVWAYGAYANRAPVFINGSVLVGSVVVDTDVKFNQ